MFFGELIYVILAPLTILGVVVLAILALSGRSEPDARGDRAYVLYLSLVSFIALFTALFALVSLGSTAMQALLDGGGGCVDPYDRACLGNPTGFEPQSGGEVRVRDALNAVGVVLAAGGVLLFHRKRSQQLVHEPGFIGSSGARTFTAYLYAVAFTAIAILLGAAAIGLPALVRSIAPGLTALRDSSTERDAALIDLVPALVAGGAAAVIYVTHWRAAERMRRGEDL